MRVRKDFLLGCSVGALRVGEHFELGYDQWVFDASGKLCVRGFSMKSDRVGCACS